MKQNRENYVFCNLRNNTLLMKNRVRPESSCRALSEYKSLKMIGRAFILICIKEADPDLVILVKRSSTVERLAIRAFIIRYDFS